MGVKANITPPNVGEVPNFFHGAHALTEIAGIFKTLHDDELLQAQIDKVVAGHALSEAEKSNRDAYTKILTDTQKARKSLEDEKAALDAAAVKSASAALIAQETANEIAKRMDAVKAAESDLQTRITVFTAKEKALSAKESSLQQQERALADRVKAITLKETELATKASFLDAKDAKIKAIMAV